MIKDARLAGLRDRAVELYRKMYDLTNPICGKCTVPNGCCDDQIACQLAADRIAEWGLTIPTVGKKIRFLGENGCVVPPHLRPLCTIHICEKYIYDPKVHDKYFELRSEIDELEWKMGELT